jgi:biofilm PGA synthesis protein PgaA
MNWRSRGALLLVLAAISMAQTREDAVASARAGRLEESISALRSLIEGGDSSLETAYDLAVILTWAKRPREATDVFEHVDPEADVPEYVLLAMTRAYWDQHRYEAALRLARRGRGAFPANREWAKLEGLISGEAADRAGDLYSALRAYAEARQVLPDDVDLRKAEAGVLTQLGAPYAAAAALDKPDLGLEAREAALMVRWGTDLRPADPKLRFAGTDAALDRLDYLIAAAETAQPQDTGLLTRLRRDRVIALRDRGRWEDAVAQAEQLRRDGDHLPAYVRQAEADALLALRRPRAAQAAYKDVIQAEPRNQAAYIGLFYTYVETEKFPEAFAIVDTLAAGQMPGTQPGGGAVSKSFSDSITAGVARNYADMNAEAWRRLYPLSEQAPALGNLQNSLGSVAAARGWPRYSADEVEIAASLAPDDLGIQIALADAALRLRRYGEARERASRLAALYPGNLAVKRLTGEIEMLDRFEFQSESSSYNEGAFTGIPNAPGNGYTSINRIYSPLISNEFRILGGFDYWSAQPPEGFVHRYRAGGGIEWRLPSLTVVATGWDNLGTVHRGGADLALIWTPTDHWNFGVDSELFFTDIPLRALLYGIRANAVGVSAGYDWNESTGWAAGVKRVSFSDGNERLFGTFRFVHRLVDRPHWKVAARPEFYVTGNTLLNAPYFNPHRAFSVFPGFDAVHILWRRYERSLSQHVSTGAGTYWEQGYGFGLLAAFSYEQIFQFSPAMSLHYGATFARRIYDGSPINSLTLSVGLSRRF